MEASLLAVDLERLFAACAATEGEVDEARRRAFARVARGKIAEYEASVAGSGEAQLAALERLVRFDAQLVAMLDGLAPDDDEDEAAAEPSSSTPVAPAEEGDAQRRSLSYTVPLAPPKSGSYSRPPMTTDG